METTNILIELIEHYKRIYVRAIIANKTEQAYTYLSILSTLHYPTYLAAKNIKKPL